MAENIEVITLTRGVTQDSGGAVFWVEGGGHRVHANWPAAEREVKARVLRSLAARSNPPDGVAFVRGWETSAIPNLAQLADPGTSARDAASMLVDYVPPSPAALAALDAGLESARTQPLVTRADFALDGDTQVMPQNFGPAAEMAAAAREAEYDTARVADLRAKVEQRRRLGLSTTCTADTLDATPMPKGRRARR